MNKHREHIVTSALRDSYDYLYDQGIADESLDVSENTPKGKNRKRAVEYRYAGKRSYPFAFIVNSGERKEYHLFYIRKPRSGDLGVVGSAFPDSQIGVNGSGEITIQIHNRTDAEEVWAVFQKIKLQ